MTAEAFDPTRPDDAVLSIDGPDYYATGWAAGLDPIPAPGHHADCMWAHYGVPAACCPCQPPI